MHKIMCYCYYNFMNNVFGPNKTSRGYLNYWYLYIWYLYYIRILSNIMAILGIFLLFHDFFLYSYTRGSGTIVNY